MNHKEALEEAGRALNYYQCGEPSLYDAADREAFRFALARYLAARDCVLMPRELDKEMFHAMNGAEAAYSKDATGLLHARLYTALIVEIDRREREEGK